MAGDQIAGNRGAKNVIRQKPEGRRQPGRPRKRCQDDVEEDLRELKVEERLKTSILLDFVAAFI